MRKQLLLAFSKSLQERFSDNLGGNIKAFKQNKAIVLRQSWEMKNRFVLFVLLLILGVSLPSLSGLLIFPFSIVSSNFALFYSFAISAGLLCVSLYFRSKTSLKEYWQLLFAFFIASLAISLDVSFNLSSATQTGMVLDMLLSATIIAGTIILLTKASGNSLSSIFLKKGDVKFGLVVGLIGFFFFALTAIPAAEFLFQGKNLSMGRVLAWLPWILPIVMLNGIREELLYRGTFLNKFKPKLGLKTANLLQATVFSLSHSVAGVGLNSYTPFVWALVVFTFSLGLIWGYIMQRTDGILGSVLFHAGTDIPVFIGLFSTSF